MNHPGIIVTVHQDVDGPATVTDSELTAALAGLRLSVPAGLAGGVLTRVGLADQWAELPSPLGPIGIAWNGLGISWIDLVDDPVSFQERFTQQVGRPLYRTANVPAKMATAIGARLAGDRRVRIALDLRGHTPFAVAVWLKALEIPRGEVRAYGWIAAEIGRPKAVRAVGTALAHNPVPLVVPCHRVVRSDGSLGQYSLGGPDAKRTVLAAEGLDVAEMESVARAGLRYVGSATTQVVCLPSCHQARRITGGHRRPFRTLQAAALAGFRPCRSCRPGSGAAAAA